MEDLEKKIKDIIEQVYDCIYTGKLKVELIDGTYYLKLFLHDQHFGAVVISNQCASEEDFLTYVEKELKDRMLIRSRHYHLNIYGNNESEERI